MRTLITVAGLMLASFGSTVCMAAGQSAMAQPAGARPVTPTPAQVDAAVVAIDQITEQDRERVAKDLAPKEDIEFDLEKRQLVVEGKSILISGDKAKARDWKSRWDALEAQKAQVDRRFINDWYARHPDIAAQDTGSPFADGSSSSCLGGMSHCGGAPVNGGESNVPSQEEQWFLQQQQEAEQRRQHQ